jgi:hypothetical protein
MSRAFKDAFQGVALFLVAIGAVYLCLGAIAAVSLMKPAKVDHELSKERLEQRLTIIQFNASDFDGRFPKELSKPIERKEAEEAIERIILRDSGNSVVTLADAKRSDLQFAFDYWSRLNEEWNILRNHTFREQERLKQDVLANYEVNSRSRPGEHEQEKYFIASFKQYTLNIINLSNSLDACRNYVADFVSELRYSVSNGLFGNLSKIYTLKTTGKLCSTQGVEADIASRDKLGSQILILHEFVGWLTESESEALAQLVGLVGFGLFGALISTYVRKGEGAPARPELFEVLARGTSAAVMVFLAAYGGIAVLAEHPTDPNPYVVFATCLAGAVFGEDVWRWARSRFIPDYRSVSIEAQRHELPINGDNPKDETKKLTPNNSKTI